MAPLQPQSFLARRLLIAVLLKSLAVLPGPAAQARRLAPLSQIESVGFTTHMARVTGFSCSEPQPRAVLSNDVLTEGIGTDEHIMPPMTVLHRCDGGSGCCDRASGLSCAPAQDGGVETVSLVFHVSSHFMRTTRFVWGQAVNHTACECRSHNAV